MSEEPKKTYPVTVDFGVSFEIRSLVASEQIMPMESVATVKSDAEMPIERLTDDDKATLVELLRETIATNRCLLSPRIRKLRTILAKLEPLPPPRPQPSAEATGAAEFDAGEEATPAPAAERRAIPFMSCGELMTPRRGTASSPRIGNALFQRHGGIASRKTQPAALQTARAVRGPSC
jgi:hypothetical protein